MNADTLVAISGYAGDVQQIESNWPAYAHHECPILVLSPEDAPITKVSDPTAHCMWLGQKGWAGPHTLVRHRLFLETLLSFPQKFFLFNDSDSVCLSPEIPSYVYLNKLAWSNEVADLNTATSHLEKIACQPPYFFHRDILKALLEAAKNPPESYYGEVTGTHIPTDAIDHYHWQLTAGSKVPHFTFHTGASWETTSEIGLSEMARNVRDHGKVFIHQVKSKAVLDRLMSEHQEFLRSRR